MALGFARTLLGNGWAFGPMAVSVVVYTLLVCWDVPYSFLWSPACSLSCIVWPAYFLLLIGDECLSFWAAFLRLFATAKARITCAFLHTHGGHIVSLPGSVLIGPGRRPLADCREGEKAEEERRRKGEGTEVKVGRNKGSSLETPNSEKRSLKPLVPPPPPPPPVLPPPSWPRHFPHSILSRTNERTSFGIHL